MFVLNARMKLVKEEKIVMIMWNLRILLIQATTKISILKQRSTYVKSVQILSYFWSVFSCIRTEYRKIRTRNNSAFGHFSLNVWTKLFSK